MSKSSLFELSTTEAGDLLKRTDLGAIAIGATEQHGPHLPLGTDAMGAFAVARRLAERIDVVLAPMIPFGMSEYHMTWPGTITLSASTVTALLKDVARSLIRHGVKRIVIINGHEGNAPSIQVAASEIQWETGVPFLVVPYFAAARTVFDVTERGHGGRMETSAVLAYDSTLVNFEAVQAGGSTYDESLKRHDVYRGAAIYAVLRDFHQVSDVGWFGRAAEATTDDAERLVQEVTDQIIARLPDLEVSEPRALAHA